MNVTEFSKTVQRLAIKTVNLRQQPSVTEKKAECLEEIFAELCDVLERYQLAESHGEAELPGQILQQDQSWPNRLYWLEYVLSRGPAVAFIWRVADGWPVEFVSQSVSDQFGYQPEDFISGRVSWPSITYPADVPRLEAEVATYLEKDVSEFNQEYRLFTKSGEVRWVEDRNKVVKDADGRPTHIQGIVLDITSRKTAEEALRESDRFGEKVMQSSLNGLYVYDLEKHDNIYINPQYTQLTGHTLKSFQALDSDEFLQLFHPDDLDAILEHMEEIKQAKDGQVIEIEYRFKTAAGNWIDCLSRDTIFLRHPDGRVAQFIGSFLDITDRKETEQKLEQSEKAYRAIAEDMPVLICCFRPDFTITYVNKMYCTYFGKTVEELVGTSFLPLISEGDRERVKNSILSLTIDSPVESLEQHVGTPDGESRWQRWINRPIFDAQGKIFSYQSIGEDITEQKEAEWGLELNKQMVEASSLGITAYRSSGECILANQAAADLIGGTKEKLLQQNFREIRSWQDTELRKSAELALATNQVQMTEIEVTSTFGKPVSLRCRFVPFDFRGEKHLLLIYDDISERVAAQRSLAHSEQRFRSLAESSPAGIYVTGKSGNCTYVNPSWCRMAGLAPDEAVGKGWMAGLHPDDRQSISDRWYEMVKTDGKWEHEYRFQNKEGKTTWVLGHAASIFDSQTRIIGYVGSNLDITDQKHMEEELRQSETKYRTLFESSPEGILIADRKSRRFYYANPAIYKMLGYAQTELEGMAIDNIHPQKDLPHVIAEFEAQASGEKELAEDIPCLRKDGTIFYADVITTMIGIDGKTRAMGLFRDTTERRLVEQQRRTHEQRLQSLAVQLSLAEQRQRHHLATELHDGASQLLSLARIKLSTLMKDTSPVEDGERLAEIVDLVTQAERATRSLTSQISPPALHDLGFAAGAEWLAEDIERLYGLKVHFTDDGSALALDESLSFVLFQCLREALVNVAKHADVKDAEVHLSTYHDNVRVSIEDKGIGFDISEGPADTRGFGLFSIAERLRQLGGSMDINSEPGLGTTVILKAPKSPTDSKDSDM